MPNIEEKINQDMKAALKSRQSMTLSVLRMAIAALREKAIALRQGEKIELTDGQVLAVIIKEVKKRKDAIDAYLQGGRRDLAGKEKEEIAILNKYLLVQLTDEAIANEIKKVLASANKEELNNFGRIMGRIMPRFKGRANGDKVSEILKKILSS